MSVVALDEAMLEAAVWGGAFLGGGGGGSMDDGLLLGRLALALAGVTLVDADDIGDEDTLVTVSAVGAPASGVRLRPVAYIRAVELLVDFLGLDVAGFITNECGGLAVVNGWLQAAVSGVPVVDAPGNGRAHPTGVMGSMGLHRREGYVSCQAAVGGGSKTGDLVETVIRGNLERAAALVRQAAVQAGGVVAVARNPVEAGYARKHGAPGAVKMAMRVGAAMLAARDRGESTAAAAAEVLGGSVLGTGEVASVALVTAGGFDRGTAAVHGEFPCEVSFWNEYMTLESAGRRLATFPDLIALVDVASGRPLASAELREGAKVAVAVAPRSHLVLGDGMRDPALFGPAETATGKEIVRYVFEG